MCLVSLHVFRKSWRFYRCEVWPWDVLQVLGFLGTVSSASRQWQWQAVQTHDFPFQSADPAGMENFSSFDWPSFNRCKLTCVELSDARL